MPVLDQHVMVRGRDINMPCLDGITIRGVLGGQRTGQIQQPGQVAPMGTDVQSHKNRGVEVAPQRCNDSTNRLHATR